MLFHGRCGCLWPSVFMGCHCLSLWAVIVSGRCCPPCGWSLWVIMLSKNDWLGLGHIVVTPVHENV